MRFIIHDARGEMKRLLTCSQEHAEENCLEGECLLDVSTEEFDSIVYDITSLFDGWDVVGGKLIQRPPKPSEVHLWDAVTRTWVLPLVEIETLREWKWAQIKTARDDAEVGGFDTPYGRFDSDQPSLMKLSAAFTMANANPSFQVTWTLQDNTTVLLTATQMLEVGSLAFKYVNDVHQRGVDLRDQIWAADTFEQLSAVEW